MISGKRDSRFIHCRNNFVCSTVPLGVSYVFAVTLSPAIVSPVYPKYVPIVGKRSGVLSGHENSSGRYSIFACLISPYVHKSMIIKVTGSIVSICVTPLPLLLSSENLICQFWDLLASIFLICIVSSAPQFGLIISISRFFDLVIGF